jgi:alkylhydroperoxidase family enzyme
VSAAPQPIAPRLEPLPADRWAADRREALRGRVAAADRYLTGDPAAPAMPNILGLFGHHPDLAASWLGFNGTLLDGARLEPRVRELLILRVAWRTQCAYEWAQHVAMAPRCGLTAAEIEAVTGPPDDARATWSARERALLRAADQMIEQHAVDDATWAALAAEFDEAELLELLFVVGAYVCLALVLNSVGLAPDADVDGTEA